MPQKQARQFSLTPASPKRKMSTRTIILMVVCWVLIAYSEYSDGGTSRALLGVNVFTIVVMSGVVGLAVALANLESKKKEP
jgi:hypothetical protein